MEILGIGLPELVFILILAMLILGPKEMEKVGRAFGRFLNNFFRSGTYKTMTEVGQKLRDLPYTLAREANEELQDLKKFDQEIRNKSLGTWEGQGVGGSKPPQASEPQAEHKPEEVILPPQPSEADESEATHEEPGADA